MRFSQKNHLTPALVLSATRKKRRANNLSEWRKQQLLLKQQQFETPSTDHCDANVNLPLPEYTVSPECLGNRPTEPNVEVYIKEESSDINGIQAQCSGQGLSCSGLQRVKEELVGFNGSPISEEEELIVKVEVVEHPINTDDLIQTSPDIQHDDAAKQTMDNLLTSTAFAASPKDADPAQPIEAAPNLWPHLKKFFSVTAYSASDGNFTALCLYCKSRKVEVTIFANKLFNIRSHFNTEHRTQFCHLEKAINLGYKWKQLKSSTFVKRTRPPTSSKYVMRTKQPTSSTSVRQSKQPTSSTSVKQSKQPTSSTSVKQSKQPTIANGIGDYLQTPASQTKCDELFVAMMINEMLPASFADSPNLTSYLKACNPDIEVMSGRSLMALIACEADSGKAELISVLENVPHVATTADCWTSHNRSFLGITVHWLDPKTFTRKMALLACRQLQGSHTHQLLAKELVEVHRLFHLDNKVVSTTTDNADNFVKAFKMFDASDGLFPTADGEPQHQDFDLESEDGAEEEKITFVEIHSILEASEWKVYNVDLPKYQRCVVHTMNLMVTSDLANIPNWTFKNHFREAIEKAQELCSKQNISIQDSSISSTIQLPKFPTPSVTSWNSLYDSLVVLNKLFTERLHKVDLVCELAGIPLFTELDIEVLQEFVKVMEPVAQVLDSLQGEATAYTGVLLPTLNVLKVRLAKLKTRHLKYMKPVLDALLGAFEKRFGALFYNVDLLLAAAFHPQFTTRYLADLNPTMASGIKAKMIDVLMKLADVSSNPGDSSEQDEDPLLLDIGQTSSPGGVAIGRVLQPKLSQEVEAWKHPIRSTKKVDPSMFPVFQRSTWTNAFILYNTAIPCSSAVESLFFIGSDILKPKRSRLTSQHFEMLMFLKGNKQLLKLDGDKKISKSKK